MFQTLKKAAIHFLQYEGIQQLLQTGRGTQAGAYLVDKQQHGDVKLGIYVPSDKNFSVPTTATFLHM